MKSRFLCMIAFLLIGGTMSAQHYTPNAHNYDNNMPIVATVLLDGVAQTGGELGAFIGNEVRGTATVQALLDNTYWIQVYYHSDTESSETITFKYFDGTDEIDITTTVAVNPEGVGTKGTPQVLEIVTATTQTTALAAGWTWWSTPVEMNNVDGLTMLENSLGSNGLTIKSQNASVSNWYSTLGYDYWFGDNITLQNETGYMIEVANNGTVSMTGRLANPEDHSITINPGWNWIGYPVAAEQNIATALSNLTPAANDVIKGQDWSSTYWDSWGWFPTEGCNMTPNVGYMYYSNASSNQQFVYTSGSRSFDVVQKAETQWKNNVHAFANNISVIAVAVLNDVEQRNDFCEVGAFVDGECRGSARLSYFEPLNRWYAVLTISGQENEQIEFRLLDDVNSSVNGVEKVSFVHDMILGSLDNPFTLHFGLENETSNITVFPNPIGIGETFNLDLPQDEVVVRISITDALGTVVRCETGVLNHSSIRGLTTSGIYMIEVESRSGNCYHGKLIVK